MTFNEFLREYSLFIALTVFGIIVIFLIFFLLIPRLRKEEEPKSPSVSKDEILTLLGGEDNIKTISLRGSRLSVELNDQTLADIENFKKHGVDRVIVMQNKLVLLVSEEIKSLFNELT